MPVVKMNYSWRAVSFAFLLFAVHAITGLSAVSNDVPKDRGAPDLVRGNDELRVRQDRSLRTDDDEARLVRSALAKEAARMLIQRLSTKRPTNTENRVKNGKGLSYMLERLVKTNEWANLHRARPADKDRMEMSNENDRDSEAESPDDGLMRSDRNYYGWMDFGKRSIDHDDYSY